MTSASALALVHASSATDTVNNVWGAVFSGTGGLFGLVFYVLFAIAMWRIFTKAGYAGFLAIIPFVNVVFLVKVAGMSGWLALLYLIPIVNVIFNIVVAIKLGRNFGKGGVFSFFLLWLFWIIGYFIIGFGDAQYRRA